MITVFTSITGGKDNPITGHNLEGAKFASFNGDDAYSNFKSDRRNSRIPKLIPHKFLDTEYSIWLDGNVKLLCPPQELIEKYLKDTDIAVFRHPTRQCIYDEAFAVITLGFDEPEIITGQMEAYRREGFPFKYGLGENMMILRRHTNAIEAFNNAWLTEYVRWGVRDQLSFMYCIWKTKTKVTFIEEQFKKVDGKFIRGGILEYVPHLTPRPEPK